MEILTVVLGISTLSFAVAYTSAVYKIRKMANAFADVLIKQVQLEAAHENYINIKSLTESDDVHTQSFIKFLSDSRDWAFEYIENVQTGIKKFISEVGPKIEYFDKYGSVIEGLTPSHDSALKTVSKEIQDLKKFLPEEVHDRR